MYCKCTNICIYIYICRTPLLQPKMLHNHQWCPPLHQPHHASPKVPMPPSLLRRHVWRRPFVAVVGRPRVAMVSGITESKGWMGITGQILTASTICMPEGSRYVLRKESYSEDGIDSINPKDGNIRFLQSQRTNFWWTLNQPYNLLFFWFDKSREFLRITQKNLQFWTSVLELPRLFPLPQSNQAPPTSPSGRPGKFAQIVGGTTRFEEQNRRLCLT